MESAPAAWAAAAVIRLGARSEPAARSASAAALDAEVATGAARLASEGRATPVTTASPAAAAPTTAATSVAAPVRRVPAALPEADSAIASEGATEAQDRRRHPASQGVLLFFQERRVDIVTEQGRIRTNTDGRDVANTDTRCQVVGAMKHPTVTRLGKHVVRVRAKHIEILEKVSNAHVRSI